LAILVRKSRLDPNIFLEILTNSLFPARVFVTYGRPIAADRFEPASFRRRRVLMLERHYTAGGFTHVFRRPGFE